MHSIDVGDVVIFFFGSRIGALGDDRDAGGVWTLIYSWLATKPDGILFFGDTGNTFEVFIFDAVWILIYCCFSVSSKDLGCFEFNPSIFFGNTIGGDFVAFDGLDDGLNSVWTLIYSGWLEYDVDAPVGFRCSFFTGFGGSFTVF